MTLGCRRRWSQIVLHVCKFSCRFNATCRYTIKGSHEGLQLRATKESTPDSSSYVCTNTSQGRALNDHYFYKSSTICVFNNKHSRNEKFNISHIYRVYECVGSDRKVIYIFYCSVVDFVDCGTCYNSVSLNFIQYGCYCRQNISSMQPVVASSREFRVIKRTSEQREEANNSPRIFATTMAVEVPKSDGPRGDKQEYPQPGRYRLVFVHPFKKLQGCPPSIIGPSNDNRRWACLSSLQGRAA